MSNIEQYLSKVDYYIEQARKLKDEARREALLKASRDVLDMLDKMAGNDINAKTAITDRLVKIDSIKKSRSRFDGVKHFMANHKKLAAIATAGIILTGSLVGCTSMQNTKEDVAVVETNNKTPEYDTDRYSRNPLVGESLVQEGTAFAESLAKNGAYDKEGYGPEMYALLGVLNTNGSMVGKDDFIQHIDLEDYFAEQGDLNKAINQMDELTEKVVRSRGDMDWNKIVPHKKSAALLEKAEKLYNEAGANASSKQKTEWNKFINDEVIADLEQYSPFTIMMLQHYITMATDAHLMTPEQRDLFYKDLDNVCNTNENVCGVKSKEGTVGAEDTIYSTSKRIAVTYLESLLKNKEEHKHADGEIYYSFAEITDKVKDNIKDLKNADIDVEKKGREESIKNIDAVTSKKYPGKIVSEDDPHINRSTGTYDTNEKVTSGNENVGDVVDLPDKDANGNPTEDLKDDAYYSDLAAQHFNNGQHKDTSLYNTQPAYKATWDAMKKAFDEASVPPPTDDPIDVEEDEKENYYPQDPVTPSADQGTSNENEGETVTSPAPGDIVGIEEDENIIYDNDYVLGDNGVLYPAGQLPEGVNPASFEEETISKTR